MSKHRQSDPLTHVSSRDQEDNSSHLYSGNLLPSDPADRAPNELLGWVALVALLAAFVAMSVQQTYSHEQLGVDEIYYFDYALKSPSMGIRIGEQVEYEAMSIAGCRGIELWPKEMIPECGDIQPDPSQLWQNGHNVAFQHTPVYFTLTAVGGEAIDRLPGVDDKLTAYRLVGAAWLISGMSLLWCALGLAGLNVLSRLALVSLLAAPPALIYTSASVHAGNSQLVGGALLLVALLLWEAKKCQWWLVPLASGLAVWLNLNNASAVGALVAYLVFRSWRDRRQKNDLILTASSSFFVAVISVTVWQLWQNHRSISDVGDLPIHLVTSGPSGFQWQQIDDEMRAVFTPFRDQWIQTWDLLTPLNGIADIGLVAMMAATLAVTVARSTSRYVVAGVFTAMIGMGVITTVSTYFAGYNYFLTPSRYGLALLPFAAIAIVPAIRKVTSARLMTYGLAIGMCVAVFYGVISEAKPALDVDVSYELRQTQYERQIDVQQRLIEDQEQLIGRQEELINLYRCQKKIDLELVLGGCEW